MPKFAVYDVVVDQKLPVGSPDNAIDPIKFSLQSGADLSGRTVLSYMVDPGPLVTVYTLSLVEDNGTSSSLGTFSATPGMAYSRQEVIGAGMLKKDSRLRIKVDVGSAVFSDIVLMYHANA